MLDVLFNVCGKFLSYIVFNMNEVINADLVRLIFIYVKCIWIRMVSLFVIFYFRTYLWIFLDIFIFLYVIIYTPTLFVIKNYVVINADCTYLSEIFELLMLPLTVASFLTFLFNSNIIKYYALSQEKIGWSFYEIEQNCVRHIACH